MDTSDYDLLEQIAAGDQAALADFYDRHAGRTLGLLRRWLGRRIDAEDVLQEVFWQVWCCARRYDPRRATPLGWVFLLARSRALDSLRRQQAQGAADGNFTPAARGDPLSELEGSESQQRLREALLQLPEEQSKAITLAFFGGMTHEQVAQHTAIPVGTAKTRIRLGIRRLRDYLRDTEDR